MAQSGASFGQAVMMGLKSAFDMSNISISDFIPSMNQMFSAIGNQWKDISRRMLDKIPSISAEVATDPTLLQIIASHSMTGKQVGLIFNLPSPPINWTGIPLVTFEVGKMKIGFRSANEKGRIFAIEAQCSKNHFQNVLRFDYMDYRSGVQLNPHYHVGGDLKTHRPL